MCVAQKIEKQIRAIPLGAVIKYAQLDIEPQEYNTAAKALERLQKKGVLKKISKGVFYKPKQSVFGELLPDSYEILKPYLFRKGQRIAYITGMSLYNQMGLTTQVPVVIKIASLTKRIYVSIGSLKAKPAKSYVEVTEENYRLLQLLDALKDFNSILDIDKSSAITILKKKMQEMTEKEQMDLTAYALKYPPRTRAFLGALLESLGATNRLTVLKETLNPFTSYKFGLDATDLPTIKKWNIKGSYTKTKSFLLRLSK